MTLTFFSNFLNPHQLPFCRAMTGLLGPGFTFVASRPFDAGAVTAGWAEMNAEAGFVLRAYEGPEAMVEARRLMMDSDVVMVGAEPACPPNVRLDTGKLTFRVTERLYKPSYQKYLWPVQWAALVRDALRWRKKPYYLLAASAYAPADYAASGLFKGKSYKWGYFPEVPDISIEALLAKKRKENPLILWAGRFLQLKHGDDLLRAAVQLQKQGHVFTLRLLGDGPCRAAWQALASELGLADTADFPGTVPGDEVAQHMRQADIFAFTSDASEGWGAVVNEAMATGCACVVSHAAGCAPYLINHGKNGMIYRSGAVDELAARLAFLLENPDAKAAMQRAARATMVAEWNGEVAANRLLALCQALVDGRDTPFEAGPASRAPQIKQKEMYEACMGGGL